MVALVTLGAFATGGMLIMARVQRPFVMSTETSEGCVRFGLLGRRAWVTVDLNNGKSFSSLDNPGVATKLAADLVLPELWPAFAGHLKPVVFQATLFDEGVEMICAIDNPSCSAKPIHHHGVTCTHGCFCFGEPMVHQSLMEGLLDESMKVNERLDGLRQDIFDEIGRLTHHVENYDMLPHIKQSCITRVLLLQSLLRGDDERA